MALLMPCSPHYSTGAPPSIRRSTPMIWASVNRVFFTGISSFILPRKFNFRILSTSGGDYRMTPGEKLREDWFPTIFQRMSKDAEQT
tara:strand:- start:275 stop:535 length:261 start_codon:yes stop_codon:yes gene_type:complete